VALAAGVVAYVALGRRDPVQSVFDYADERTTRPGAPPDAGAADGAPARSSSADATPGESLPGSSAVGQDGVGR
jgi:hypothetical protein